MKTQHETEVLQFSNSWPLIRLNLVSYCLLYIVLNDSESTGTTVTLSLVLLYYSLLQTCQRAIV